MRVDGNQAQALEVVDAVVAVARALLQPGTTRTNADAQTRSAGAERHVVAQYNAQVSALKRAPSDVDVARLGTVDKFQGKEVPVVIYSCTSSSPEDAPLGMAFLCDPHRFNVATSRARSTVIVVASPQLFEPDYRTSQQMEWANLKGGKRRHRPMPARQRQRLRGSIGNRKPSRHGLSLIRAHLDSSGDTACWRGSCQCEPQGPSATLAGRGFAGVERRRHPGGVPLSERKHLSLRAVSGSDCFVEPGWQCTRFYADPTFSSSTRV